MLAVMELAFFLEGASDLDDLEEESMMERVFVGSVHPIVTP
jgi:hypothetical protein